MIENIHDLTNKAYIPYDSQRPIDDGDDNTGDNSNKLVYDIFCNKYKTANHFVVVDCYSRREREDDNTNRIEKKEINICRDCLNEYQEGTTHTNRLVVADKMSNAQDLIYNGVVQQQLQLLPQQREEQQNTTEVLLCEVAKELFRKDDNVKTFFSNDIGRISTQNRKLYPLLYALENRE